MATVRTASQQLVVDSEKKTITFTYPDGDMKVVGNASLSEDKGAPEGIKLDSFNGNVVATTGGTEKMIGTVSTSTMSNNVNMNITDPAFASRGAQVYQLAYDTMTAIVQRYTITPATSV